MLSMPAIWSSCPCAVADAAAKTSAAAGWRSDSQHRRDGDAVEAYHAPNSPHDVAEQEDGASDDDEAASRHVARRDSASRGDPITSDLQREARALGSAMQALPHRRHADLTARVTITRPTSGQQNFEHPVDIFIPHGAEHQRRFLAVEASKVGRQGASAGRIVRGVEHDLAAIGQSSMVEPSRPRTFSSPSRTSCLPIATPDVRATRARASRRLRSRADVRREGRRESFRTTSASVRGG